MNLSETLKKFKYPSSLLYENENWRILLRPSQITFGSMVLINKEEQNSKFSDLSEAEQTSMFSMIKKIEYTFSHYFKISKINYLALMMVDPFVHYHVLPRHKEEKKFEKVSFKDSGFPGIPDLNYVNPMTGLEFKSFTKYLRSYFEKK